jgi:predicted nucleotidyltransferase
MVTKAIIKKISQDLDFLKPQLLGIILFGSYANDSSTIRSDIDICLVVGHRDVKDIFNKVLESDVTEKYDIKIFEILPIYLKAEVMQKSVLIWAADEPELSYYLHHWNRIVYDQFIYRQKLTA